MDDFDISAAMDRAIARGIAGSLINPDDSTAAITATAGTSRRSLTADDIINAARELEKGAVSYEAAMYLAIQRWRNRVIASLPETAIQDNPDIANRIFFATAQAQIAEARMTPEDRLFLLDTLRRFYHP